jgi:hypothetical protein
VVKSAATTNKGAKQMVDIILGFLAGVFFTRFVNRLQAPKIDRVLAWDESIFAWRPVPQGTRLEPGRKYLGAMPVMTPPEASDWGDDS